jgi:membrane associated rhomboid family serine protease
MGKRGGGSGGGAGGGSGYPQMQFSMMVPMTPVVKWLIIVCVAIWLVFQVIVEQYLLSTPQITFLFGLVPLSVIQKFYVWQLFTYIFLHSFNPLHILFNMLLLWWLGSELEQRWGSKFFLSFFLVSGVGAGIIYTAVIFLHAAITHSFTGFTNPVVGASGAIFGLMLAYGMIFGERVVYFMMVFPMRAKYFVLILGGMEVVTLLNSGIGGSDVANLAHLGGIASGYIFLRLYTKFQQSKWRKQSGKRGRGLRLVVNNDGKDKKDGPKYWN